MANVFYTIDPSANPWLKPLKSFIAACKFCRRVLHFASNTGKRKQRKFFKLLKNTEFIGYGGIEVSYC